MAPDYRPQAKALIESVAHNVLLPAGYIQQAPTVFTMTLDDGQITHVVYFRYDKYTRRDKVQIHLDTVAILNDHPQSKVIQGHKDYYRSLHEGVLYSGIARLRYPRIASMSSTVIIDNQTDLKQLLTDASWAVRHEISHMGRSVGSKRSLINQAMYKRRFFRRSIKPNLALARYFAHTGQTDRFEQIWQALKRHRPERFNDQNKAELYDKNFYRAPKT